MARTGAARADRGAGRLARFWPADARFRRLWVARLVSNLGNGMAPTAMAFGVLSLPHATARQLGFVLLAQAVPLLVMLPLGGVLADRLPRALIVSTTDLILGVVVVVIGTLFLTGTANVWNLAALNLLAGALNGLWYPAFPGLVPAVVGEHGLQRANAQLAIASNAGMISGTAVAAGLIAAFGPGTAVVIDGLTFLIAGGLVFTFRYVAPGQPSGESMLRDLASGWSTFVSFRWLWSIVAAFSVVVACMRAGLDVGGPVLMKASFSGATSWAVIQTGEAIGYLAGALLAARYRPARPLVHCLLVSAVLPAYLLALAVPTPYAVLVACGFLLGAMLEQWGVLWITVMQSHIPRESLSRASAFDAMGSLVLGPLGLALAGPVIAAFGLRTLFVATAAITAVVLALPLLAPEVRQLR